MKKSLEEKQKVKTCIENAAIEVLLERGYRGTTVREIARKANMTNGNIYFYYPSKEKLYESIVEPAYRELKQLIQSGQRMILQTNRLDPSLLQFNYQKAAHLFGKYRKNILVLFTSNVGTRYQPAYQNLIDEMSELIYEIAQSLAVRKNKRVLKERFYFRLLGVYWVEGFLEIVRNFQDERWARQMLYDYVEVIFAGLDKSIG
ncbi:MAG: TetR/AcrR family transcriptional regulator [Spirochaetota bacterium]